MTLCNLCEKAETSCPVWPRETTTCVEFRMANHRNRKLLDLAHEVKECQIQLPGICEGFAVDGCEPVHSDRQMHGKGMGLKAHDCYHAAGCHSCHMAIHGNELSRGEKQEAWRRGYERTQLYYWQMGWVKVA